MPSQPPMPPPASCLIDTRDPATGAPLRLRGVRLLKRWQSPGFNPAQLREALRELATGESRLLVGVLPYSFDESKGCEATLTTLLMFAQTPDEATDEATSEAREPFRLSEPFRPDWSRDGYVAAVSAVRRYLAAGDAYQVNLSQRFRARYTGDVRSAWEAIRASQAPPYAAWVDLGDRQILGFSPESFLEVHGRTVVTRPIKGTRPRHADPAQDLALARDLAGHPKDRAENLMIVDLLRNDLGRVCEPGSIRVPALFELQSFRNVHHLVSTVTGTLRPDADLADLLTACFPGGSITGAPKRRAMEIIDELEPHARDIYCGSIFWALPDGRFGSNIAIRTFLAQAGELSGWAGAGIVIDSDPEAEYRECLDKLAPLMRAFELYNK